MQRRGWFITFEGIDGAGKSSHIEAVAEALRREGRTVTVTREPGERHWPKPCARCC